MANEVQVKTNVGDQVIARVNSLCEMGFNMPKDYSYVNAIKMSMLKLQDVKDKNGKSCLEVCTPVSIQTALFRMVTRGLNIAYNQAYAIIRGNNLCIDDSYFGKVLMVKRIYPDWNPMPVVIREGDEFELGIDPKTGAKFVKTHNTKLENTDNDFVGGYMYLPTGELFVMTKKQILTAWSKSSSREQTTHKQFSEKMVSKTLVNSGCNMIINSTPEYQMGLDEETAELESKLPETHVWEEANEVTEDHVAPQTEPQSIEVSEPITDTDF